MYEYCIKRRVCKICLIFCYSYICKAYNLGNEMNELRNTKKNLPLLILMASITLMAILCELMPSGVLPQFGKMYGIYYGRKEVRLIGESKLIYISLKIPPLPVCTVRGYISGMSFRFFIL